MASTNTPRDPGSRSFISDDLYGISKGEAAAIIRDIIREWRNTGWNVSAQQLYKPKARGAPIRFLLGAMRPAEAPSFGEALVSSSIAPIRLFETAARGLSTVGVLSVGINLADAVIKHDRKKAIEVVGTTAATGLAMEGVAEAAGARAVPIVGEVVGGVFAAKDAYDAARSGHKVRAAASGIEAGLYAISLGAALTGAGAPIAFVAGGAAVTMTAARTLRDNWSTVSSWFDKWSNDFAAIHVQLTRPTSSGMRPRQLTIA